MKTIYVVIILAVVMNTIAIHKIEQNKQKEVSALIKRINAYHPIKSATYTGYDCGGYYLGIAIEDDSKDAQQNYLEGKPECKKINIPTLDSDDIGKATEASKGFEQRVGSGELKPCTVNGVTNLCSSNKATFSNTGFQPLEEYKPIKEMEEISEQFARYNIKGKNPISLSCTIDPKAVLCKVRKI